MRQKEEDDFVDWRDAKKERGKPGWQDEVAAAIAVFLAQGFALVVRFCGIIVLCHTCISNVV